jgi:hypothetical protein
MTREFVQQRVGSCEEYAAVPAEGRIGEAGFGECPVGFLDERLDKADTVCVGKRSAKAQIAIARRRS